LESGYYLFEPIKSYDDKTIQKRWKSESREKMNLLAATIKGIMSFDATTIESEVKQFMEEQELGQGEVLPILRLAVSGTTMGPSVFDIMALLGHQETVDRMAASYKYFDEVILNEV
jgi:glutamyl-tRNA synthetase